MKYEVWDVWMASVRYEDSDERKERPVLVLDANRFFITSAKMTSTQPRNSKEYLLEDWKRAGLSHATTVQLSRVYDLTDMDFVHRVGRLTIKDITAIRKILNDIVE